MSEAVFRVTEPSTLWVGDRAIPWARIERRDLPPSFPTFRFRSARIMFENGWTVSFVWGDCSHSSNNNALRGTFTETPTTVELGILDRDGDLVGDPVGYVDVVGALYVLDNLARAPSGVLHIPEAQ